MSRQAPWKKDLPFKSSPDAEARYIHRQGDELFDHDVYKCTYDMAARKLEYAWVVARIKGRTLDVGSGCSDVVGWMARQVPEFVCCDPGDYARDHDGLSAQCGVEYTFQRAYMENFTDPKGTGFDSISCISVIEHVPDDHSFIKVIKRHLRPNGVILLTMPYTHHVGKVDPVHPCGQQRYYTIGDIHKVADSAGLQMLDINFIHCDWPGAGHPRFSAPNEAAVACVALG